MAAKVALLALSLLSSTAFAAAAPARTNYTPLAYFKNYALSACLADGYESAGAVASDASAAARGYLELGDLPLEAHTEATLLGREFLKREYSSKAGEPLVMMKCLDFFHSKELEKIARKYLRKP